MCSNLCTIKCTNMARACVMSGSRMQVQLIRCLSCQSFLTVIDNTSIAMVKLLMTLVVAALVCPLTNIGQFSASTLRTQPRPLDGFL